MAASANFAAARVASNRVEYDAERRPTLIPCVAQSASQLQMRRSLLLLLLFVLASATLNLPVALQMQRARQAPQSPPLINESGALAAARGWPAATPHTTPWPTPSVWQSLGNAGYERVNVYATTTPADGTPGQFNMQVERMGWPLPALERVQMWWPWDDPAWTTSAYSDPPLRLAWPGALLNPLLIGTALWIVFVLPVQGFCAVRRRLRARYACCRHCGYPCGTNDVCSECGKPFAEPARDS